MTVGDGDPIPTKKRRASLDRAVKKVANKEKVARDVEEEEVLNSEKYQDGEHYRGLRQEYSSKVYFYLAAYSLSCLLIVVLQGFRVFGFYLDTPVLAILVGSTAVSAIGLVGLVIRGLFK